MSWSLLCHHPELRWFSIPARCSNIVKPDAKLRLYWYSSLFMGSICTYISLYINIYIYLYTCIHILPKTHKAHAHAHMCAKIRFSVLQYGHLEMDHLYRGDWPPLRWFNTTTLPITVLSTRFSRNSKPSLLSNLSFTSPPQYQERETSFCKQNVRNVNLSREPMPTKPPFS